MMRMRRGRVVWQWLSWWRSGFEGPERGIGACEGSRVAVIGELPEVEWDGS